MSEARVVRREDGLLKVRVVAAVLVCARKLRDGETCGHQFADHSGDGGRCRWVGLCPCRGYVRSGR